MDHPLHHEFRQEYGAVPNTFHQLPSQYYQAIPTLHTSRAALRRRLAPPPHLRNAAIAGQVVHARSVPVPPIKKSTPRRGPGEDCVRIFKEFHSGKGAFRSHVFRERGLTVKLSVDEFRLFRQCLQPSGAPMGPDGGTAKSPGRDRTAKHGPSSPFIPSCRATLENDRTGRQNVVRPRP